MGGVRSGLLPILRDAADAAPQDEVVP